MPRRPDPNARDALLRAARQELRGRPAHEVRVEDIARAAGLSKGAFYLHFASKDAAVSELVARFLGAVEDLAARRRDDEQGLIHGLAEAPTLDAIAALMRFHVERDVELLEIFWRHRDLIALCIGPDSGAAQPLVDALRRRVEEQCLASFRAGQAAGRVRAGLETTALVDLVMGAWDNHARRLALLRDKPDFGPWAQTLTEALWLGILPRLPEQS